MASSFPRRRESRSVGTETYRENGFLRFYVLDSHFRGNDGLGIFIESRRWCFCANDR
ncbi:pilus assembly protein PilS [Neisseria meningitidis]|nr:pilus assembly protein PilS [Neisseria meningitidis]RQK19959.1 pilus assembly protein PilS [Neisseria meningitidis]RQK49600.1 pilus assembly protein PilS [Neisseria meningitidis]RQK68834.1 pilus assembly protein PilS [Neisseria meningitidis]RQK72277.1 pilus assembly protein PilS [Neisseria meningitidis]